MHRFFECVTRPLLDAARARLVVEVGSDQGDQTRLLANWCASRGARLHVIDPLPKYDPDKWVSCWPSVMAFHRGLSLDVLPGLGPADMVCLDGDHNWYTVFHELETLGSTAEAHGRTYPLTLLHDVGWPYGRRDLYYDPDTIPGEHRQEHRQGALVPGQGELGDSGFNDRMENAVDEGTLRNGVLTAVEDYVEHHQDQLRLHVLPGLHGLGILVDEDSAPSVHDAIAELTSSSGLYRILEATEHDRALRLHREASVLRELADLRRGMTAERAVHAHQIAELQQKQRELASRIRSMREEKKAKMSDLGNRVNTLREEKAALRRSLHQLQGSGPPDGPEAGGIDKDGVGRSRH